MKRLVAIVLSLAMLMASAACGNTTPASSSTSMNTGSPSERITLRILAPRGVGDFPDGSDESNNIFVDYLRENTPYDFEYTFYSQESAEDRNMLIASGNTYDIISWPSDAAFDLVKLKNDGYLAEIDEYLSLAPKACAQVEPEMWSAVKLEGKTISLPMPCKSGNMGIGIRTDWLNTVGKKMPTTLEEFKDILVAFRDGDPDGNGKQDTIPLSGAVAMPETTRMFRAMFDINAEYDIDADGKVFYSLATDKGRDMLKFMNELYSEKLLDNEAPTMKRDIFLQRMTGGSSGSAPIWWWMKKTIDRNLTSNLGIADLSDSPLQWIDPMMLNAYGNKLEIAPSLPIQQYLIFPKAGNTAEAMKFIETCVNDPVADYLNFGEENVHWKRDADGNREMLEAYGEVEFRWHYCDNLAFDIEKMTESENIEYGPWRAPVQTWTGGLDKLSLYYRIPPVESVNQLYIDLNDFVNAEIVKFMTSTRSLDTFDAFVKELDDKYQLQTICNAFAEAYQSSK